MGVKQAIGLIVAALLGVLVGSLQAAEREPFFQKDSARDVLPASVLVSDESGIEYFLPQHAPATPTPTEDRFNIDLKLASDVKPAQPATAQKILTEYGDPSTDAPVAPVENAPKPFKAMLAALNAGERELAFQYARQYARYTRDLKDKNTYMTGLIGKGMEVEGVLPANSWASSPQFHEIGQLAEESLANQKAAEEEAKRMRELEVSTLNPEQLAMLEKAKEEVDWGPRQEGKVNKPVQPVNEAQERQNLRTRFRGTVPLARDGRIDIYLFARIGDSNATPTMFALQELYKKHGQNLNLKFHGFSIGMATEDQLLKLPQLGITYPVENGTDLARRLKIEKSPTLVFVSHTSGESITEEGDRPFYYLEELLSAMGGVVK